VVLLLL